MSKLLPPCRRCGCLLYHRHHHRDRFGQQTTPPGARRHEARGLCNACYVTVRERAALGDYPRAELTRDEVLTQWSALQAVGVSRKDAARWLGLTVDGLNTALSRARRAGDRRAA